MLDIQRLLVQIAEVGKDSRFGGTPQIQIVALAQEAYDRAAKSPSLLLRKLEDNYPHVLWPTALPLEPFGEKFLVGNCQMPTTVVACDGSQIMPSHHEVHSCYLLNIGLAIISYGQKLPPVLESRPKLHHLAEDLYPLIDRRRLHVDELYVSLERNLLEMETVCQQAIESQVRGLPVVALLDGSLIPWSVERMPETYQKAFISRMSGFLDETRQARIPLIGYLSQSRSADLVNNLRIWLCPYAKCLCREFCGHLNEEDFPCSSVFPLTDRKLLKGKLQKSYRSAVFASGARVSQSLPEKQRTCFVYVNVGAEVARLEFPRWLFDDKPRLDLALEAVLLQTQKGRGYPVALAEAHFLAVIRGSDRTHFFNLLSEHLISLGLPGISVSPKESGKRRGGMV